MYGACFFRSLWEKECLFIILILSETSYGRYTDDVSMVYDGSETHH